MHQRFKFITGFIDQLLFDVEPRQKGSDRFAFISAQSTANAGDMGAVATVSIQSRGVSLGCAEGIVAYMLGTIVKAFWCWPR